MDRLSDDELALILRRITSRVDRKACAQVCRQWLRVEGATRTALRILDPLLLSSFLPRFPFLASLEAGRGLSNPDLALIARTCPALLTLNLSIIKSRDLVDLNFSEEYEYDAIGDDGISAIAASCKRLQHVNLRWRQGVGNRGVSSLVWRCIHLTHLDLARCERITDEALEVMAEADSLQVLILKGCKMVTDAGLRFLACGKTAFTVRKLDLCECSRLTDEGVALLQQMLALQGLYLAKCGLRITDTGAIALASLTSLQCLNLSWLPNISDSSILAIGANCTDLRELVLSGCDLITGMSLLGFSGVRALTLTACCNIFSDDVEAIAASCHSLEYLGLDKDLRRFLPASLLERMESRCNIEWF